MNVLVTGGAGFIGSHTVSLLLKKGVSVRVFDSLVSGKRENVAKTVEFIQGDIRNTAEVVGAMRGITHVVHLAALTSVAESMANPIATHDVNVSGTENLLDVMRTLNIQRLVYASSAAVYGDTPSVPKHESDTLRPLSPYALSKAINEMQASLYERAFDLKTIGLRFFNVYGPGQRGSHPYASVIPRWIEAMRAGQDGMLYGDGSQTRDFVHVRDVAEAIRLSLTADVGGTYNIASGEETSLSGLKKIIAETSSSPFQIQHKPNREGDILRSVADTTAAKKNLGFTPSVGLVEGITELISL